MTDTTCPSCDAPAPARARACARCGYRFFEDGGPADHLPRPDRTALTLGAAATALVIAVIAAAVLLTGGGGGDDTAAVATAAPPHLTVLSQHPAVAARPGARARGALPARSRTTTRPT